MKELRYYVFYMLNEEEKLDFIYLYEQSFCIKF